jgi:chemotaxis methyl-accepting protein methylase
MYIVRSRIKALAKSKGKRVSASYVQYLERRVYEMVVHHINLLGSRVTLNVRDAEALDAFRMTRA